MELEVLVGEWISEMSRPETSAEPIRGRMVVEPLFGEHYLRVTSTLDHPDVPDSMIVIGRGDETPYTWHYFDSRGVSRTYKMTLADGVWTVWREDPDFWQRFTGRFSADGSTITGAWEMSHDGGAIWEHDFDLTYTKV
jgi:hypothetical protein